MPVSVMETVDVEMVSQKGPDIQEIAKSPKTVSDFFKTPEKVVLSKQKSLLQYFTKTNVSKESKIDTCTEKENSASSVQNGLMRERKKSTKNVDAEKKPTEKDSTPQKIKRKSKVPKKKQEHPEAVETKLKDDSQVVVTDKSLHGDSEDLVVLVSDTSNLEENLTEQSDAKTDSSPDNQLLKTDNEIHLLNFDRENVPDTGNKVNNVEEVIHKNGNEATNIEKPVKAAAHCEGVIKNSNQAYSSKHDLCEEKSDLRKKEELVHDNPVTIKSPRSKFLSKKKTLKCKEMMTLLKETLGPDYKEKKKSKHKHKHKHRLKEKLKKEITYQEKNNPSGVIVTDKKKEKNKVKFTEPIGCGLQTGVKSKTAESEMEYSHASEVCINGEKIQTKSDVCASHSSDIAMTNVEEKHQNEIVMDVNAQDFSDKGSMQAHEKEKCAVKKPQKIGGTESDSQKMKKNTKDRNKKKCLKESNVTNVINIQKEEKSTEIKSISYEDFLRNLEKEGPASVTEQCTSVKDSEEREMSYSKLSKDCEEKDPLEELMETSGNKNTDMEQGIASEDNLESSLEVDIVQTTYSDAVECGRRYTIPKQKKHQNEIEAPCKLVSAVDAKSSGIARFFSIVTSTPDKPTNEKEDENILHVPSPDSTTNNTSKKSKKSKQVKDVITDSDGNNSNQVNTDLSKTGLEVKENMRTQESDRKALIKSDSIIVVEGIIGTHELNEEAQKKKHEFLNSKSSVSSTKTTQAVLNFSKTGLTMAKSDSVDLKTINTEYKENQTHQNVKKGSHSAGTTVGKSKEKQNLSDDSNVFETPKCKARGRKSKIKTAVDMQESESDESSEHSQTDESLDGFRRRSSRKRYKVAKFEMDEEKRTPIKLKLKRDEKQSSSFDEVDRASSKTKKIKLTPKRSKAKALVDKAKKHKKKSKLKHEKTEADKVGKENKKSKRNSLENSGEAVEHRRSSRLVGKIMPSMEEVSLENIMILSDDEDEYDGSKKKKKKVKRSEKFVNVKADVKEVPIKDSPKPKKIATLLKTATASPRKKTTSPKKTAGKLAPIFMGKTTKTAEEKKPPLDPEVAKQRMQFLMSGVPEELKKQSAKTQAAVVPADYPPIPTISHVLQIPETDISREGSVLPIDIWQLNRAKVRCRRLSEPFYLEPMSRFNGDLINRQMVNVDLSPIKKFTQHPPIDSPAEEACVGEVSCYNPGFPVNKIFTALKKLKQSAEQLQQETDKPDNQPAEPEIITVIEDEPEKKKRGRKPKLKLQKEEKLEAKKSEQQTYAEKKKKLANSLLWTDKYQPCSSSEVIGNSGSMKKLKNWLSEWKHVLDREAKKARKLLMKKNKGKMQKTAVSDDQWDEDSDFDMDSESSDIEDTLCNTMLITGPHGCGKTTAVYALAQELGFKVHEVNASSSRNGKRILSQLQEATQSHQVSHQGCGTPVKNPGNPGPSTPKRTKMPTAFTNLFNKKKETPSETVIQIDDKKSKKRKREAEDKDESPKKKRSKKNDNNGTKVKTLKPTFLDIDESSNGLVQGLNLSSTTMILFDEVDIVFEDDKGFLSAVQTFMATTKIPIVMTTTSSRFAASFDGRYETLTFKQPSVASLCSYVQLICLLEGLRMDPIMLSELVQLFKCDVRKILLSIQFVAESGGAMTKTLSSVAKPSTVETNQVVPVVEETIESSQDSQESTKSGYNPTFGDNDDDDFVMLKPRTNRQRRLIEDDNSNSVDAFAQMLGQKETELVPAFKQDEDVKIYPVVHRLGVSSLVGRILGQQENMHDIFLRNMKMPTITNLLETCSICEIYRTYCQNLMSNNLPLLLPLVSRVTDHMISSNTEISVDRKGKKRKRIQTDLYDSEASNDAVEDTDKTAFVDDSSTQGIKTSEKSPSHKAESRCSVKTLSAFSRFCDTSGMLDIIETQESLQVMNPVRTTCGRRLYGSVHPGLDDSLPKFQTACDLDCEVSRCYSTEVEVRSMSRLYQEVDRVQGEVEQLCKDNPAYSEEYVLPVLKGKEKFSLVGRSQPSPPSGEKRAEENVVQNLPLFVYNHHRPLHLDYLPTLREVSRTEQARQIANTKRRFHHYLDFIALPLKDTTLNILSSTFT